MNSHKYKKIEIPQYHMELSTSCLYYNVRNVPVQQLCYNSAQLQDHYRFLKFINIFVTNHSYMTCVSYRIDFVQLAFNDLDLLASGLPSV
jgi:hypothetical protein